MVKTTFTAESVEELKDMLIEAAAALAGATCNCTHTEPGVVIDTPTFVIPEPTVHKEVVIPEPQDKAPLVDANGHPWDERIHSSNKKLTAAGVWQKRRGVTDTTVAEVTEELDAAVTQETLLAPATLAELMAWCTDNGKTPEDLGEACKAAGVNSAVMLAQNPEQIPAVFEALNG